MRIINRLKTISPPLGKRVYREIFERLNTGIALVNPNGACLKANPAFRQIFGFRGERLNLNPLLLEMLNVSAAGLLKLLTAPAVDLDFRHAPCHNIRGERVFLSYAIKKLNHNLIFFQVADTTREKLEGRPSREQERFIEIGERTASIVHAIKGTSVSLTNTLEVLAENPESFPRYSANLGRLGRRLSEVVSMVLRTGALPASAFAEVDLPALLKEIAGLPEISARLQKNNIDLSVSGPSAVIEGLRDELRETFVCLIENAIDAILEKGESGGKITVVVKDHTRRGKELVEIMVEDNGCGIPRDKLQAIFQPFYTTKKAGSGVGLAVAKKVVEVIHNGEILVESQPKTSTYFRILLPRRQGKSLIPPDALDSGAKVQQLRQQLAALEGNNRDLIEAAIESMTLEHIRESALEDLKAQISGQIKRLQECLATGRPHVSVNNFSRRTEVVIACDKDSASRAYWENLILHELQKMGLRDQVSVFGTRTIEQARSVCRVFEIKQFREKLCEEKRRELEVALHDKFTPLPTLAELNAQMLFLENASKLTRMITKFIGVHSLIFNPALDQQLRMVSFRVAHFSQLDPLIEEAAARRFLSERTTPEMVDQLLIQPQKASGGIYLVNQVVEPAMLIAFHSGTFLSSLVAALGIRAVIAAAFGTPRGGEVINLLYSGQPENLSPEVELAFLTLNQHWEKNQEK